MTIAGVTRRLSSLLSTFPLKLAEAVGIEPTLKSCDGRFGDDYTAIMSYLYFLFVNHWLFANTGIAVLMI